jgi:hypothetical protein
LTENIFLIIALAVFFFIIAYFLLRKFSVNSSNETKSLESDARKFARLLVSEIKLYEDYKVQRGLKKNNLYESLEDEIESARKKYKKRVPDEEFDKYFEDALADILADGDKSRLGIISTSLK